MRTFWKLHHVLLILALVGEVANAHAQPAGAPEPATDTSRAPGVPGSVPAMKSTPADAAEKPWNRGVPLATRQAASKLFDEGYRFLTIPLFARAAEKFQEALALYQHPAIYFNLALAQLNLVQPVEAYESFGRAMAYGAEPIGDVPYGQAEEYRRRLEQQLGHLAVQCDQPGAAVTIDGRPLFTGPGRWQGVVVPGEHQLLASADGFIPAAERVVVSPGERSTIALALRRPERTVTVRYMPAWIPWASLGVGAAVLGVGGYVQQQASDELAAFDDDFNRRCPRGCTEIEAPGYEARLAGIGRDQAVARGLYIAGGTMVIAGAALLYVNRERVERRADDGALSIMPTAGPGSLGMTARVKF
jgi:tetratricopeptide (TPR) repeat protein